MERGVPILIATSGWPGGDESGVCCVYTAGKRRASLVVSQSASGSWWDSRPLYSAQIPKCLVPLSKRARFTSSYKARVLCLPAQEKLLPATTARLFAHKQKTAL